MRTTIFLSAIGIAAVGLVAPSMAWCHEGHHHDAEMQHEQKADMHDHGAGHEHTDAIRGSYSRSLHAYLYPDVTLVNADARRVRLLDLLAADGAIMIDFISTRCESNCAAMSRAFSMLPERLGPEAGNMRRISFFIDPQHDTPAEVKVYARQYGAPLTWQFLTGSADDIERVRRAFDGDGDDAMHIKSLTLLRPAPGKPWLRIEGLASADELVREYRALMDK